MLMKLCQKFRRKFKKFVTYIFTVIVVIYLVSTIHTQDVVDYLATHLHLQYDVITNEPVDGQFQGKLTFTNTGSDDVSDTTWEIYFCSIRLFEETVLRESDAMGVELGDVGIQVFHVDGCLHKLAPTSDFTGFPAGEAVELPFKASHWTVARTDIMPKYSFCLFFTK